MFLQLIKFNYIFSSLIIQKDAAYQYCSITPIKLEEVSQRQHNFSSFQTLFWVELNVLNTLSIPGIGMICFTLTFSKQDIHVYRNILHLPTELRTCLCIMKLKHFLINEIKANTSPFSSAKKCSGNRYTATYPEIEQSFS